MSLRKVEVKDFLFEIRPADYMEMHYTYPFFAYNIVLRPRMAIQVDEDGKRILVVPGMSEKIEREENFLYYTSLLIEGNFCEDLDLRKIDRIQFLDMVQSGFPYQYPDNRTGREDFTLGKLKFRKGFRSIKIEVNVTILDVEDPGRYPASDTTDAARYMTGRYDEMENQEVADEGRNLVSPVFEEEYEKGSENYFEDIKAAWSIFMRFP